MSFQSHQRHRIGLSNLGEPGRVSHLTGPVGGLNGTTFLTAATVHDDGVKDVLIGAKWTDYFIVSALDTLDLKTGEQKLTV